MTSPNNPLEPSSAAEQTAADTAADSSASAVKPFSFPFAAETFSPTANKDKPWHQLGNKSNHDKRPGAAPKGTRRSMGKR